MSPENTLFAARDQPMLEHTFLVRHRLEEQFADIEHQSDAAALGMWVFLGTEVLFFGAVFTALGAYRLQFAEAFEAASARLNWVIGGINTLVLLVSSFFIVLAVHYAKLGSRRGAVNCLALTALLGCLFLGLKSLEYYLDFGDKLVPRLAFDPQEWIKREGLLPDQTRQVELFLMFYWIMTGFHALHVTIGIVAVVVIAVLCWRRNFTGVYYSPIDTLALYWHFVDVVWIFLLPMLYLLGTHRIGQ